VSGDELTERAKQAADENGLLGMLAGAGSEVLLLERARRDVRHGGHP
jgi:hypothetical protein